VLFPALLLLPKLVLLLTLALILSLHSWALLTLLVNSYLPGAPSFHWLVDLINVLLLWITRRSNRRPARRSCRCFLLFFIHVSILLTVVVPVTVVLLHGELPSSSCLCRSNRRSCFCCRCSKRRFLFLLLCRSNRHFHRHAADPFLKCLWHRADCSFVCSFLPSQRQPLYLVDQIDVLFVVVATHAASSTTVVDHPVWFTRWGQFLMNVGRLLKRPACLMKQFSLLEIMVVLLLATCCSGS